MIRKDVTKQNINILIYEFDATKKQQHLNIWIRCKLVLEFKHTNQRFRCLVLRTPPFIFQWFRLIGNLELLHSMLSRIRFSICQSNFGHRTINARLTMHRRHGHRSAGRVVAWRRDFRRLYSRFIGDQAIFNNLWVLRRCGKKRRWKK